MGPFLDIIVGPVVVAALFSLIFLTPNTEPVEFEEAHKEDQKQQKRKVTKLFPKGRK